MTKNNILQSFSDVVEVEDSYVNVIAVRRRRRRTRQHRPWKSRGPSQKRNNMSYLMR